jgi:hypothetical protein
LHQPKKELSLKLAHVKTRGLSFPYNMRMSFAVIAQNQFFLPSRENTHSGKFERFNGFMEWKTWGDAHGLSGFSLLARIRRIKVEGKINKSSFMDGVKSVLVATGD